MKYRPDIDGLRAIAVLGVVMFHFGIGPFTGGFTGVDIFFVISGYLITNLIVDEVECGEFSFKRFYGRRVRRLFPALFFTLVCSVIAAALLFSAEQMTRFGFSVSAAVFSVSNILFWSEHGYFDVGSHLKPLLHTWSLSVEEQFYLVWPFALVWLLRFGRTAAVASLVLIFAASLGANLVFEPYQSSLFYLSPFRFFEFAVGAALVFMPVARANAVMEVAILAGIALIAIAYLYFSEAMLFPSYPAMGPTLGAAMVIWGGRARWLGLLLRNRLAVSVGLISYSLYLAHWPLFVFWQYMRTDPLVFGERIALLAITFAAAVFMYFAIERPFRKRTAAGFAVLPKAYVPAVALAAVVASAVGVQIWTSHGWLWRLGDRGEVLRQYVAGDRMADAAYGGAGCKAPCSTVNGHSRPDVIFIGDSHARQYYLGAKDKLADLKVDFYEFSSCQFYSLDYTRNYAGFSDAEIYDAGCRAARAQAFTAIRSNPDALVILGEYWNPTAMVSEKDGAHKPVDSLKSYYRFVGDEIARLKASLSVQRMAVLGSVPTAADAGSSLDCFGRPYLTEKSCSSRPRVNAIIAQRAETNMLLATSLPADVTFIDPFDELCTGDDCSIVDKSGPIYFDSTHLSGLGAKIVISGFVPEIRRMLPTVLTQASQ